MLQQASAEDSGQCIKIQKNKLNKIITGSSQLASVANKQKPKQCTKENLEEEQELAQV